jgi:hypothetical protein
VRHLRPAGAVDGGYSSLMPHPAMSGGPVLGMPAVPGAVRPPALLRKGDGTGCCWTRRHRSIHCRSKVIRHLGLDMELVGLFTHLVLPFFPSFSLETKR